MKKPKNMKLWWSGLLLLGGVYLAVLLWPVRDFVRWDFLSGNTLVLLVNEAEARPCGGFLTAFGVGRFFPPSMTLKNSYHFAGHSFGPARGPLAAIANDQKIWDLGTSPSTAQCAQDYKQGFEEVLGENIDRVILLRLEGIEKLFARLQPVLFQGKEITTQDFFSTLSRTVADVDRHDEAALQTRKTPLASLAKGLVWRAVLHPLRALGLTREVAEQVKSGDIYISDYSQNIAPRANDFAVIEWNLGGGKSSRYLQKTLRLSAYETTPNNWEIQGTLDVQHLGGYDEPLSQQWKGEFEIRLPKFLGGKTLTHRAELLPGETTSYEFSYSHEGALPPFGVFSPYGQTLNLQASVSLYPQQAFATANFPVHEGVGQVFEVLEGERRAFAWEVIPDTVAPFLTLHTVVDAASLPQDYQGQFVGLLVAEVHLSEPVEKTEDFMAVLTDRNYENADVTDHPVLEQSELLPGGRTLLLGFRQQTRQKNERFYLELSGLVDAFGNVLEPKRRTIIDREP